MTIEEAIEYWEQFNAEIDDLYDACSDADRDTLVKQREIVEYTISALRQQKVESKLKVVESNESLTLDELRQIDGVVWVCYPQPTFGTQLPPTDNMSCSRYKFSFAEYGKTWLAYRQKPEEVGHD